MWILLYVVIGEIVGCVDKLKKGWVKGVFNVVLCCVQCEGEMLLVEVDCDFLVCLGYLCWLLKVFKQVWLEQFDVFCVVNNVYLLMILWVNWCYGECDVYLVEFVEVGIKVCVCDYSCDGIQFVVLCDVCELLGFVEGCVSVQDEVV